ncbi:MAG: HAMP domain-containing sensor histidine kinase, partial [Bacteroidota bacterium]
AAELETELLATNNRQIKIIGFGLLTLLVVSGFLLWRINRIRLALAETNATKDKFFGIIAHDLRNPVVGLNMATENLRANLEQERLPEALRQSNQLEQAITRLSGLIDNLLRWALVQTGQAPYQPGNLHLETVVSEVAELYAEYAQQKDINLQYAIDPTLIVHADEQALRTILRNLISNALKFTASGGTVRIGARPERQTVAINVKDNGVGMGAATKQALFDLHPQSRSGTNGERGSGLGLRLCRELAEQNRGSIRVESQLQAGSNFIVTFPLVHPPT